MRPSDGIQREARTKTLSESDASHVKLESRQSSLTSVKKETDVKAVDEPKEKPLQRRRVSGASVEAMESDRTDSIQGKDTVDAADETPTLGRSSSKGVEATDSPQEEAQRKLIVIVIDYVITLIKKMLRINF